MAFKHGKDTKVYLNSANFSTYFSNADATRTADTAESTTFGNSNKTYVAGDKDGTVSLGGFFDATADGVIQPLLGGSDFDLVMGIDGLESVNDYKAITLFDALRNTDVIKRYNEQYKKEFGVPSCFDKVSRSEKT